MSLSLLKVIPQRALIINSLTIILCYFVTQQNQHIKLYSDFRHLVLNLNVKFYIMIAKMSSASGGLVPWPLTRGVALPLDPIEAESPEPHVGSRSSARREFPPDKAFWSATVLNKNKASILECCNLDSCYRFPECSKTYLQAFDI